MKSIFPNYVEGSKVLTVPPCEYIDEEDLEGYESAEFVILPEGLKTLGRSSFYEWKFLKGVYIPDSVEEIEEYAFFGCESLESIKIPSQVKTIPPYCFCQCDALKEVTLSDNIETFSEASFDSCISLESIKFPSSLSTIGKEAFAFSGLKSACISEGVKEIADGTFAYCNDLASVVLPKSLEVIGEEAFKETPIENIDLPEGLKKIGREAFMTCDFKEIVVPESVEYIGDNAFSDCFLSKVTLPSKVEFYGQDIFVRYELFDEVPELRLPHGVKKLHDQEFHFFLIGTLYLPSTIEEIDKNAFKETTIDRFVVDENNPHFASIDGHIVSKDRTEFVAASGEETVLVIPDSIKRICQCAFVMAPYVKITFPLSVKTIESEILQSDLEDLTALIFENPSPGDIDIKKDSFYEWTFDDTPLYVPSESIEAYREHPVFGGFKKIRSIEELKD